MKKIFFCLIALLCMTQHVMALEIDKDKFYTMSNRNDNNLYIKDTGADILQMGSGVSKDAYWRFIPSGNPNCYYVQNLKTGRYAQACATKTEVNILMGDEPVEYKVLLCSGEGADCYGLASTNLPNTNFTSGCIGWNWKNDNTVQTYAAAAGTNHRSFWKFAEATPPACMISGHTYENGVCTICGEGEPNYITRNEEGFYELTNAQQVEWFADLVNGGDLTACAVLMNDIDMTGVDHKPIGHTTGQKFNGIFDGRGHRIMNMIINRPDQDNIGFFGFLRGNNAPTMVRNLIIDKSCSITARNRAGGIAGSAQNGGASITIENCVNEADITVSGQDAAGIVGGLEGGNPIWIVRNCVNTGNISSTHEDAYLGAFFCYTENNASSVFENLINLGTIGMHHGGNLGRLNGNVINVIDLSDTEDKTDGVNEELTMEDVASGRLAFYMNGNQKNIIFYQTIGTDPYPVPFKTSQQVYFDGPLSCNGEPIGDGNYTNDGSQSVIPVHVFIDGDYLCQECGTLNEHFMEPVDGVYQIGNALQLCWFAEYIKSGHNVADAVLLSDIDLQDMPFSGIGSQASPFTGHFDGQHHTISNLDMSGESHDWSGFFNFVSGGSVIENLRLDKTCIIFGGKGTALVGGCGNAGTVVLRGLANEGEVLSLSTCGGGILGANFQSIAKLTLENCYSTGSVNGGSETAAIAGWLGNNGAIFRNNWTIATASGIDGESAYAARHQNATFSNNYSLYGTQFKQIADEEEVTSGALAFRLNEGMEEPIWRQNLDNGQQADAFPTTNPSHGIVYPIVTRLCDGSFTKEEATYSNTDSSVIPDHKHQDGYCTVCGHEDPDYPFLDVLPNADHNEKTGYTTNNSGGGSGLAFDHGVAEHWDMKWFDTYQTVTGLQPGVYKLRVKGLQRIEKWGQTDVYATGEPAEEYMTLHHSSQYYVEVGGKKVANRFMDITEGKSPVSFEDTENYSEDTECYVPNSLSAASKYFAKGRYMNAPLYFVVKSEQDEVKVGVENNMHMTGNWTVWDEWRLEYVGETSDQNIQLIAKQQQEAIQELDELEPMTELSEAYEKAAEDIWTATDLDEIIELSDVLSRTPLLIRASHIAYKDFTAAIDAVKEEADKHDLNGLYADMLKMFLDDYEDPSNDLPNGTYTYIMEERLLDADQLKQQVKDIEDLLLMAIRNSISEGADLTNLVTNPAFDQDGSFGGWNTEVYRRGQGGDNLNSNTGFTEIYPVAGSWNTAFSVWQDLEEGLPDGIYEIEAPAFNRPGDNREGNYDGSDLVNSDIFINDYHTPVMNIYAGQILHEDAVNGVNCRFDATGDPNAPHNGEQPSSQDTDTGDGYVPEQRYAMSFAFNAGRYTNHAYAIVTDGKLRIGIRNTGEPWYEKGVTCWGKFTLRYHGKSMEAMDNMLQNYRNSLEAYQRANDDMVYYFSTEHIDLVNSLIAKAEAITDADARMKAIQDVNAAMNAIPESHAIFQKLIELMDYCYEQSGEDEEKGEDLFLVGDDIEQHLQSQEFTDQEAIDYYYEVLDNEKIGGGLYVQGDLLDAEGGDIAYSARLDACKLTSLGGGKYTGVIRTQNRANRKNADNRAGIYFTQLFKTFRSAQADAHFVTPAANAFTISENGTYDLQMTGGEFRVNIDTKAGTIDFETLSYCWNDNVYVCGTILDDKGDEHRWKNDEAAPLRHLGNGVYEGNVTFYEDYNLPGFATFTIMTCRATEDETAAPTATRLGWQEGRYASADTELLLEEGVSESGLIRNRDGKWKFAWDGSNASKIYTIHFDMNTSAVCIKAASEDAIDEIRTDASHAAQGIYNLAGQKVQRLQKGIYIINGNKVTVK